MSTSGIPLSRHAEAALLPGKAKDVAARLDVDGIFTEEMFDRVFEGVIGMHFEFTIAVEKDLFPGVNSNTSSSNFILKRSLFDHFSPISSRSTGFV